MRKDFNDTGLCNPDMHYMVETSHKLDSVMDLIARRKYFTMNSPRQFGKTTTASLLYKRLLASPEYLVIRISLESEGEETFTSYDSFIQTLITMIISRTRTQNTNISEYFEQNRKPIHNFESLRDLFITFIEIQEKKVVLIIDEVDKSSNYKVFLEFLGMLRDTYLLQNEGIVSFFQSVILVGVHDIKNLKRKVRPEDKRQFNSPWNIATDFTIDLSFSAKEIQSMLKQYVDETGNQMPIEELAERLYYYTSGYPYLVSKMCKIIDELIITKRENKNWSLEDVEESFRYLVNPAYETTLFDDLAKNLNNDKELYNLVFEIVINGNKKMFNIANPVVSIASTYGILKPDARGLCKVHNRIFEKKIYDMMISIRETSETVPSLYRNLYETDEGDLDLESALLAFQEFMQENYSNKDLSFLEREGRLLFMSFLKPILNGKGFDFKEPVVGDERRADIIITYESHRYLVELKRWQGDRYHQKGLQQLCDYLDLYNLNTGYLLIYDFRKNKEYKSEWIEVRE
ncbi:MAG: hypothetical protein JJT94_12475, partial [Bernardetiaceae bacterium]|nr:hypothetical protein [Bernardetiaceae bacterium]